MTLIIRYSREDASLRSVGDQPNGIVAVASPPDGVTFVVDSAFMPSVKQRPARDTIAVAHVDTRGGIPATSTRVAVSDIIDGCESRTEVEMVLAGAALCVQHAARQNATLPVPLDVEMVLAHVALLSEVREDLVRCGWIQQTSA